MAFETNWHTILHDETRMSGRLRMTNNNALTLALVMAGLAAASYRFGYTGKGIAIVAIMAACVFACVEAKTRRVACNSCKRVLVAEA
jgi:hypothetical protein